MPESPQLTELQISVLSVLWDRGEATTAEVCEALRPQRELAHTTVATLLSRLERRGVVEHAKDGRQYVYRALFSRGEVRSSKVAELTDALFGGDPAALVSHLVSDADVSPAELRSIRRLIEEADDRRSGGRG
ncbi:MAG TPA: BlaI/MecI/CopY family transcriptional regulator [Longimicrobiales bacterium]